MIADTVLEQFLIDRETNPFGLRLVICDLSASPFIDLAGSSMLHKLHAQLSTREIPLRIVGARGRVRKLLSSDGLAPKVGGIERGQPSRIFLTSRLYNGEKLHNLLRRGPSHPGWRLASFFAMDSEDLTTRSEEVHWQRRGGSGTGDRLPGGFVESKPGRQVPPAPAAARRRCLPSANAFCTRLEHLLADLELGPGQGHELAADKMMPVSSIAFTPWNLNGG